MDNNNELLLQEGQKKKKQLYKNWKLYASALGSIVIGLGVGVGILGAKHNPTTSIAPINLNNLNTSTINGIENMTADDAFKSLLKDK